jgi:ribulose-5-phosphate 4-epimerase/fuculose-1-phosphate aldolase
MILSEGVIKFTIQDRRSGPPLAPEDYQDIEAIRAGLWQLKLIGHDRQADVGYGNISRRRDSGGFVISGTQTGFKEVLDGSDYVVVDGWDFSRNRVSCTGPCLPSSESLSHAALYQRPDVGAVIHVHSRKLWDVLIQAGALSTEEDIAYGSEALYRRLSELAGADLASGSGPDLSMAGNGLSPAAKEPPLPLVIVTKGHQDGVFVSGRDLAEAYEAVIDLLR